VDNYQHEEWVTAFVLSKDGYCRGNTKRSHSFKSRGRRFLLARVCMVRVCHVPLLSPSLFLLQGDFKLTHYRFGSAKCSKKRVPPWGGAAVQYEDRDRRGLGNSDCE
jgi:hypothetical protein